MICIQTEDFSIDAACRLLKAKDPLGTGAICTFTGLVRDFGDRKGVSAITLEHYPGMTEKSLARIIEQAQTRWQILDAVVIHRVGRLVLAEQIVFVGVSAAHRNDAFAACQFIMDYLKTDAPFWKKEHHAGGETWVEAKHSDLDLAARWQTNPEGC
jgi:molybdopterin synthase catalytic subunit